ncbi:hypothetical protein JCM19294_2495 [Nonlabens tegetincola]|uniref:Uncharacterized protein n=1 Tax=Nonlabens tegetincola TaxID=323273 RepID=A0A090Q1V7_9FLAO|nr:MULTISPECIES: hypothetical protein [Nonlabens]MEE2800680.1 hypothetical protein [Bacteroidota bacterium]ALM20913.1 hypothetical protein AAT17_06585 [Nonlabens sp. MIC269]ARN72367.1 hypothetical protein BST91_12195 [Nonlabens tegetincola]PQJ20015.1 hypothetical protein BST93_00800 [Nonlabens tegetincola]GAK95713.1 hypothetical protein JCM19294_2495 [Nonlabens tegetincola]
MKTFYLIGLLMTFSNFSTSDYNYCGCGDFEGGITHYQILNNGRGCCTGTVVGEYAYYDTYVNEGEAWHWIGREFISPAAAQESCCSGQNV